MLTTDDDEIIVRATYLSGAYEMNYKALHRSPLFEELAGTLPAHNARMTNLTAAIARPRSGVWRRKGSATGRLRLSQA